MSPRIKFEAQLIQNIPMFRELDQALLNRALQESEIIVHHHQESLFSAGQPSDFFGFVIDGVYKLTTEDHLGEEVIFHFGTQGEPLAIMSALQHEVAFPFHAISLGTSRFLKIPRKTFLQEWRQIPELLYRFQNDLQGRIFRAHEEKLQQRLPMQQKVAQLFLYLSVYKSEKQSLISFPLTRKEIASYVGSSVESIIRLLSLWAEEKIIHTENRQIQILNRPALIALLETPQNKHERHMLENIWSRTSINSTQKSKSKRIE